MRRFLILLGLCLTACIGCRANRDAFLANLVEQEEAEQQYLPVISPGEAQPEDHCADPQPDLVRDQTVYQPPARAKPAARTPFRDPVFGSCLVRVTDNQADLPADAAAQGLKNEYARVQAFNADGRAMMVMGTEGDWFLYDTSSLEPLGRLPLGVEPRWDAADPDLIYHSVETSLHVYNIATQENDVVHDFAPDLPGQSIMAVWTKYEGRPAMDSRYWGLMAEDEAWLPVAFLVYDRQADQVIVRDMRGVPGIEDDVDHVTISPMGNAFLASFDRACPEGQLGEDERPCGLMAYDRDLNNGRGLLRTVGHYDTAIDADGREVIIFQDIDRDQIAILDLQSGLITPLYDIDFSHTALGFHFSGLAYERPGWALVSTYSGGYPEAFTWMDDQVFAVELRQGGQVVRLAHTHSLVNEEMEHDYWAEPQATVNQDFTRILFTSNWGQSGTDDVDLYVIKLPSAWSD